VLDFWITDSHYFEQPDITAVNEMIFVLYTYAGTYTFGSTGELNEILGSGKNLAPSIKVRQIV
jgi:hypothetical protein